MFLTLACKKTKPVILIYVSLKNGWITAKKLSSENSKNKNRLDNQTLIVEAAGAEKTSS